VCDAGVVGEVLGALRSHPLGARAAVIGAATSKYPAKVCLETAVGGLRLVDMLVTDQLPRIC